MTKYNLIACNDCRQCNRKGRPSVMRGSAYCDSHVIKRIHRRKGIFGFISKIFFKEHVKNKYTEERTKYNEDGTIKSFNKKGFRESWFYD